MRCRSLLLKGKTGLLRGTSKPSASASLGLPLDLEGGGRRYRAYPNLSKARWIFPADHPTVRRAGISELFRPSSLKGRVLKRLILAGRIPGEQIFLKDDALTQLETEMARALAEPDIRIAFYTGVPGAYRKVTAQAMTPHGKTLAFAKIATSQLTQGLVEDERRILLRLSENKGLSGRVPQVLRYFDWQGGRVLLMTAGPSQPGPRQLSSPHLELCKEIFLHFAQQPVFEESPMMFRMSEALRRLSPHLPGPLFSCLDKALARARSEIGPVSVPLSLSHRDFAPWNTRMGPHGLFVFDWDRAEDGMTLLYDLFHFQAIQAALLRRREPLPDRQFLRRSLDAMWPEGHKYLPWLYLSYLLDMSLIYSEAQVVAPGVGEQRVWNWYGKQVESFLEDGPPV